MPMCKAAIGVILGIACTVFAQEFTPPLKGTWSTCPTCGQRLRGAVGERRSFGDIAEDLEAAAAEGGTGSGLAGGLARAVRFIAADAATGNTLHEILDPAFKEYPQGRAPYERVADVLTNREVTAGLPPEIRQSYEKLGKVLLNEQVCVDLSLPSDMGEWSSREQLARTLGAIRDKYAPGLSRARRTGAAVGSRTTKTGQARDDRYGRGVR